MLVQFFETLKLISLHYSFVTPAFFEGIWQGKATAGDLELLQSCLGLWWVWMVMNTVCFLHLSFLLIKTSYLLAVSEAYHGGPPQSWEKHWEAGILLREVHFMTTHRGRVQVKSNQPFSSSFEDFLNSFDYFAKLDLPPPLSLHSWTLWSLWLFTSCRYFHEFMDPVSPIHHPTHTPKDFAGMWHVTFDEMSD